MSIGSAPDANDSTWCMRIKHWRSQKTELQIKLWK